MIHYPVKLSTTEPNNPVGVLKVRQDDKGTQKIVARITTNSKPQDLIGLEVAFNMRTTEGNVVIEKAVIKDAKLGIIEYVVSGYATQKAGRNTAYFTFFIGEDEQFSTKDFSYFVTNSVTSEGIRGCDYIWRFDDLLEFVTYLANQSQIQLNKLTSDVEVIQKQIDDMFALIAAQGVLSADEVRKIMINFLNGEDIEVTIKSDFTGKVAGSIVENGNNLKWIHRTSLALPSANWSAATQVYINMINKLDGVAFTATAVAGSGGLIPQVLTEFNALWILEKNFPSIFKNAITTSAKVAIAKSKITKFQYKVWAKASGPTGTLCTHSMFNPISSSWGASTTSTGNDITQRVIGSANASTPAYLNADGNYYFASYAEPSNDTLSSSVSIDYTSMDLTVKFNIKEFVPTRQEFDSHVADTVKHITATERTTWNAKQDKLFESGLRYPSLGGGAASHATFRVHYEKSGRLVDFGGRLLLPLVSTGAQVRIGSVPPQFSPQLQKFYEVAVAGRQTDLFANIVIDTDGQIYCYYCNTASQYFSLDLINYLTKD
ncbi:phage baseplate upper protein [Carnobacterium maltaromaticum]|uniref:phage baseplate upper protein n=1 Tax=Carnobacterium maltaromaticum TaxID=2751 RepID=UPI003B9850EE